MTHNIQGNYMVPWKAFKSLPAEARAVLYLFVRQKEHRSLILFIKSLPQRRCSKDFKSCITSDRLFLALIKIFYLRD